MNIGQLEICYWIDDILHRNRRHREVKAFYAQRRKPEDDADHLGTAGKLYRQATA